MERWGAELSTGDPWNQTQPARWKFPECAFRCGELCCFWLKNKGRETLIVYGDRRVKGDIYVLDVL
jgi:hypothetical protein